MKNKFIFGCLLLTTQAFSQGMVTGNTTPTSNLDQLHLTQDPVVMKMKEIFEASRLPKDEDLRMGQKWVCTVHVAFMELHSHLSPFYGYQFYKQKNLFAKTRYINDLRFTNEENYENRSYEIRGDLDALTGVRRLVFYFNLHQNLSNPEKAVFFKQYNALRVTPNGELIAERSVSEKDLNRFSEADPTRNFTTHRSSISEDRFVHEYVYCPESVGAPSKKK